MFLPVRFYLRYPFKDALFFFFRHGWRIDDDDGLFRFNPHWLHLLTSRAVLTPFYHLAGNTQLPYFPFSGNYGPFSRFTAPYLSHPLFFT